MEGKLGMESAIICSILLHAVHAFLASTPFIIFLRALDLRMLETEQSSARNV